MKFLDEFKSTLAYKFRYSSVDEVIIYSIIDVCKDKYSIESFTNEQLFKDMISYILKKHLKDVKNTFYDILDNADGIECTINEEEPKARDRKSRYLVSKIREVINKLLTSNIITNLFTELKKDITEHVKTRKMQIKEEKLQLNELRKIAIKLPN